MAGARVAVASQSRGRSGGLSSGGVRGEGAHEALDQPSDLGRSASALTMWPECGMTATSAHAYPALREPMRVGDGAHLIGAPWMTSVGHDLPGSRARGGRASTSTHCGPASRRASGVAARLRVTGSRRHGNIELVIEWAQQSTGRGRPGDGTEAASRWRAIRPSPFRVLRREVSSEERAHREPRHDHTRAVALDSPSAEVAPETQSSQPTFMRWCTSLS